VRAFLLASAIAAIEPPRGSETYQPRWRSRRSLDRRLKFPASSGRYSPSFGGAHGSIEAILNALEM